MPTTSFTQLDVWKKAHRAVLLIYKITRVFPPEERYGLSAQMRTAAVSIASNIAEGYGRRSPPDKARFYNISQGSAQELKYQLILTKDLEYATDLSEVNQLLEDVLGMLRRLCQATYRNS